MNRRQILIELARANLLTEANQLQIRTQDHVNIHRILIEMDAPQHICAIAGLPRYYPKSRKLTLKYIQQQVDAHLSHLDLPSVPIKQDEAQYLQGLSTDRE